MPRFRLRMLSIDDVEKDFEAVTSSAGHLRNIWPGEGWPEGLTLDDNLVDLGWHQKEFQLRSSFAYTMVSHDESEVLGCVYINPTRKQGYDAEVYFWVRESELGNGLDEALNEAVAQWLLKDWPFDYPAMPGRSIDWSEWNAIPEVPR